MDFDTFLESNKFVYTLRLIVYIIFLAIVLSHLGTITFDFLENYLRLKL